MEDKWISSKDRLPVDEELILAFDRYREIGFGTCSIRFRRIYTSDDMVLEQENINQ